MTTHVLREWTPATVEDLVADAEALGVARAGPRMITDWTARGLLGSPSFRKSTRHGSDARVYSPDQRRLFCELLTARQRSVHARIPNHVLIRLVLYVWLVDDTVVAQAQARRAWRTWAEGATKGTGTHRRDIARAVVDQFAHPSASHRQRRKAQVVIEEGERTGKPDWRKVKSALTEICSPWPAPDGQRVERSIGTPELPFGVEEAIRAWTLQRNAVLLLVKERIPEPVLLEARGEHRDSWAEYQARRPTFRERATRPEMFEEPTNPERSIEQQLTGFVHVLSHVLGQPKGQVI